MIYKLKTFGALQSLGLSACYNFIKPLGYVSAFSEWQEINEGKFISWVSQLTDADAEFALLGITGKMALIKPNSEIYWIGPIFMFETSTGRRLKWSQFSVGPQRICRGNIEWHFLDLFQSSLSFLAEEGPILRPRLVLQCHPDRLPGSPDYYEVFQRYT